MEEEKAREKENEKDAEVMAVAAAEVSGKEGEGGVFTKSQAESAAPFVDATDGDGGSVGERTKRRRTGVASERWRGGVAAHRTAGEGGRPRR